MSIKTNKSYESIIACNTYLKGIEYSYHFKELYNSEKYIVVALLDYLNKLEYNVDLSFSDYHLNISNGKVDIKAFIDLNINGVKIKADDSISYLNIVKDYCLNHITNILLDLNHKDYMIINNIVESDYVLKKHIINKEYSKFNICFFSYLNLFDIIYSKVSKIKDEIKNTKEYKEAKKDLLLEYYDNETEQFVNKFYESFKFLNYNQEDIDKLILRSLDRVKISKILK